MDIVIVVLLSILIVLMIIVLVKKGVNESNITERLGRLN